MAMVETYKGRRIAAIARRRDGFAGVLVRINGNQVWHYGPESSASLRTVEGAIQQAKREIDAVDAYTDDYDRPRFSRCWYRKTDPRHALALD
jgi:hypothetical protein